jgi:hypothetical protein
MGARLPVHPALAQNAPNASENFSTEDNEGNKAENYDLYPASFSLFPSVKSVL